MILEAEQTKTAEVAPDFSAPKEVVAQAEAAKAAPTTPTISFKMAEAQREFESQRAEFEERTSKWESEKTALTAKAAKADTKLQDLWEEAEAGNLSKDELLALASHMALLAEPEHMSPEAKLSVQARKAEREKAKLIQEYESKIAATQKTAAMSEEEKKFHSLQVEYQAEATQAVESVFKENSYLAALYGGPENLSRIVVGIAENNAGEGKSIEPAEILGDFIKAFEPQFAKAAEEYMRTQARKQGLTQSRPSPVGAGGEDSKEARLQRALAQAGVIK